MEVWTVSFCENWRGVYLNSIHATKEGALAWARDEWSFLGDCEQDGERGIRITEKDASETPGFIVWIEPKEVKP